MAGVMAGKAAIVTGGGMGIGKACAVLLAQEGAKVCVADVAAAEGEETAAGIRQAGGEAFFIKTDVSKVADVQAMVARAVEAFGRLDCAVNNAGIEGIFSTTVDCTEDNWDAIIDINLKGVWLCMKYEIIEMLKAGGGSIVNTASILGVQGAPRQGAYVASKHGVLGLTKSAALEYGRQGIRINAVCPGMCLTPMMYRVSGGKPNLSPQRIALGRQQTPEELATATLFLCSDASAAVTGHALMADGGMGAQ